MVNCDFMKEELIKKKLLAEFREWFCEGYCQFYGMDDYCRCCPVKDESCWLRGIKKKAIAMRVKKYFHNIQCDVCRDLADEEKP